MPNECKSTSIVSNIIDVHLKARITRSVYHRRREGATEILSADVIFVLLKFYMHNL